MKSKVNQSLRLRSQSTGSDQIPVLSDANSESLADLNWMIMNTDNDTVHVKGTFSVNFKQASFPLNLMIKS